MTCRLLTLIVLLHRGDAAKEVELLVLRQENAVLRRHLSRVRFEPADQVWFACLSGLLPRTPWAAIFSVTPA